MIPSLFALLMAFLPLLASGPPSGSLRYTAFGGRLLTLGSPHAETAILQTSTLPPAFPRDGAKQLIDNERVTVWDVVLPKGKPTVMHRHKYDMVRVELADTTVRVTNPGRSPGAPGNLRMGTVGFDAKGMAESQETTSDTPRHAIMIELKDVVVPPIRNTSGYPDAFPREGAKKVFDNARVVVWDFSWTPGKPTAMHFHDKDVVVVYLGNGDLSSTTPAGQTTVNSYTFGQSKFNPRDRAHTELLVKGSQRVIAVELK